jgi:hypothetical protein
MLRCHLSTFVALQEREPKIKHTLENSQESKMVATISDKLSKEINNQSAQIELISQRLIWGLRGFADRLHRNFCNIPFTDKSFVKASEHVLHLVTEMRTSVNLSRSTLMAEMQGDEGAADCLIWRNASKDYKRQAKELDDQMRELIMLAKVAKRMLKEVIKVCKRGARQEMYADSDMRHMLESALVQKPTGPNAVQREKSTAGNAGALGGTGGAVDKSGSPVAKGARGEKRTSSAQTSVWKQGVRATAWLVGGMKTSEGHSDGSDQGGPTQAQSTHGLSSPLSKSVQRTSSLQRSSSFGNLLRSSS